MRFLGGRSLRFILLRLGRLLRRSRLGSRSRSFGLFLGRLGSLGLLGRFAADAQDPKDRELLAVTALAAIIVAAALLEDGDLLALGLGDDLGRHRQAVGRA